MSASSPSSESGSSSDSVPKRKISLLVVQLGGADAVLRSLMAMKAVKHLYPAVSFHVIAHPSASEPLRRVEWVDSVMEIPRVEKGEDALRASALWIEKVILQNYDILANWTPASSRLRMAAIVSSLIPAVVKLGDYLKEDLSIQSADAWTMYRHAWCSSRIEQDIHETDLITTQLLTALQIHAGDGDAEAGPASVTSRYFFKSTASTLPGEWLNRPRGLKWIAFHAGSAPERSGEWIQMVLKRHPDHGVVVIGTHPDLDLDSHPRLIRLGDGLGFDSMVSVLVHCGWIFTGAHPLSDLASLLNLRVFFNAPLMDGGFGLKWTETGPYGNGHVALVSREEWTPETAYATWSYYQNEWFHKSSVTLQGHFDHLGLLSSLEDLRIYRSRIRPPAEGGGVCFEQTAGPMDEFEGWIYRVRGQMARAWFCGWLPEVDAEVAKLSLTPSLVKRIRTLGESVVVLERLSQEGRMAAIHLKNASERTKTGYLMSVDDRAEIEDSGKKLLEVEGLMARVVSVEPELDGLLQWYRQMIHNLSSQTIAGMAKETANAFDLVTEGLDLISAYTKKTLELAKPKAITSTVDCLRPTTLDS